MPLLTDIASVSAATLGLGLPVRAVARARRRPSTQAPPVEPARVEPCTGMHVLRTPEDLAAALDRAAAFEARAAARVNGRLERYDLLRVDPPGATPLRAPRSGPTQHRSTAA